MAAAEEVGDLRAGSAVAVSGKSDESLAGGPSGFSGSGHRRSIELTARPAAAGADAGAGGRLAGLQGVWGAGSKREAELALARLVAGEGIEFCVVYLSQLFLYGYALTSRLALC